MDNKHATPEDLAYLAGLLDGEGCIAIQKCRVKGHLCNYGTNVKITNTDMNIIEKIQSILLSLGINPNIRVRGNENHPRWKSWIEVYLTKRANIKLFLENILPYLVGKKARAIIMLRFIDKQIDYEEAFNKMKVYNKKGGPSETTREAPFNKDEDIVQAV